jgi:putative ABC transport system substrate-binding protein
LPIFSWGPVEAAAPSFSVTPIAAPVRAAADVDHAFDVLAREPNGGLMVLPDISMTNHRDSIIALAARHRVPAVYPFRYFAASDGLMSYGTDVAEVFRRAAGYREGAQHRGSALASRPRRRDDRVSLTPSHVLLHLLRPQLALPLM